MAPSLVATNRELSLDNGLRGRDDDASLRRARNLNGGLRLTAEQPPRTGEQRPCTAQQPLRRLVSAMRSGS